MTAFADVGSLDIIDGLFNNTVYIGAGDIEVFRFKAHDIRYPVKCGGKVLYITVSVRPVCDRSACGCYINQSVGIAQPCRYPLRRISECQTGYCYML